MEIQLLDNLIEVLDSQKEIYDKILKLSKNKTDVIINGKVDELEKFTKQEQTFIINIAKLEDERQGLVSKIAEQTEISSDSATLSELIQGLDKNKAEKLESCRKNISEILAELKSVNELNSVLIKNSLEYVEFSLNMFSAAQVSDNNYGNSGKVSTSKKRSLFDIKL